MRTHRTSGHAAGNRRRSRRPALIAPMLAVLGAGLLAGTAARADDAGRCVSVELYVRNDNPACKKAVETLQKLADERAGVKLRISNLDEKGDHVKQFERILKYFRVKDAKVPVVYCCKYLLADAQDPKKLRQQVESALTITAYVRAGCPHCAAAKKFLAKITKRYPGYRIVYHDVIQDQAASDRMYALAKRYRQAAVSLPAIHFCNSLSIGYIDDDTTGKRLEATLKYWTVPCKDKKEKGTKSGKSGAGKKTTRLEPKRGVPVSGCVRDSSGPRDVSVRTTVGWVAVKDTESAPLTAAGNPGAPLPIEFVAMTAVQPLPPPDSPLPPDSGPLPPGPPPGGDLPPPPMGSKTSGEDPQERAPPYPDEKDTIRVPVFGELSLSELGMPAFTFLVGLVDGFNPCAMWVLLFLLSVLVNLKSRAKILAVAGTFVVVSGAAYFAFMAAWLNIFLFVGYLEWVQRTLGATAVVIGAIHIKDFFAFKKGVSFSIPESAKPGIYARVRGIVSAHNLLAAIIGASVLAVLVNIIELLCTLGLPALYTNILMMQKYPAWKNYAYLGLYNVAYMFDDTLMVAIVVVTLGRHKLQERGGRWLKLVSGAVIFLLGVVMIFKPKWLV